MSSTATPNLALTYIVASQAQKEVTHNAALNDLDFLTQLSVIDYTVSTPPSSPATSASYIIGPSPTRAWAGNANAAAVHCRHAPLEKPAFPLESLTRDASTANLLQACLQTDKLRQAYELTCGAIVKACK